MGLKIDYIDETGVQLSYWNILSIDLSLADNVNGLNIVVRGYPSYAIREKYNAVRELKLHFADAQGLLRLPAKSIYDAIYQLIKTVPEFSTAEDVFDIKEEK